MQEQLFYDSYTDAQRDTILALGGNKKVGSLLWPTMPADEAGRKIARCLNPNNSERFNPDELALIRKLARQAGVHILASYEMRDAGYADPQPIEPEDEQAALKREFIEATKLMSTLSKRMERAGLLQVVA